jgi:dTDP-4-dehydrorhamnose reductase/beta-phosphoglucomutase-like phosphatase (HAD superfamily)
MIGIGNGTGILLETILSNINFIDVSLKNVDNLENIYNYIDNSVKTINSDNLFTSKDSLNILLVKTEGDYFIKIKPYKKEITEGDIYLESNIDNIEKNLIDTIDKYMENTDIHYIYPYRNEKDKEQFIEKIQIKSSEMFDNKVYFKKYNMSVKETVIVCGGSGLVGRILIDVLEKNNMNVIGTYNSNKLDKLVKLNFFDIDILEKQILEIKPTICISTIAERQNEICENNWEKIKNINIDIVSNLSIICKKHNIFLIHLSTDYVYDGLTPPFSPESFTNPLQNYGISKLIAEQRVLSVFNDKSKFLILRVPVLYSDKLKSLNESAVSLIIKKVMNKVEIFNEDNFSVRRPVFIEDLAVFIVSCIHSKKITGVHCFYNPFDKYTKYQISELSAKILNKNIDNINRINDKPLYDKALRPIDTELYDISIHDDILNKNIKITLLDDGLNKLLNKYIHPIINFSDINVQNDIFFLLDLDGTLVDSEIIQWKSYRDALEEFNINYTFEKFTEICHNGDIKEYLMSNYNFSEEMYLKMKNNKKKQMLKYASELKLIDGVSSFINYLYNNNINYCIVTNSSKDTVDIYKSAIPELNKLKNWIMREDYVQAKPSGECYIKAKSQFYNGEKYIIGFENSISGLKSIKNVTDIIYFVSYKEYLFYDNIKNEDVFLIKNFNDI